MTVPKGYSHVANPFECILRSIRGGGHPDDYLVDAPNYFGAKQVLLLVNAKE